MAAPATRLRVRVSPGARRAQVAGRLGEAVCRLLAETLSVPRRQVALVAGHGARDKVVELAGVDAREAERLLEGASA